MVTKPYIDTDIENIELYLSWKEFKSPPSRKSLFLTFDKVEFDKVIDKHHPLPIMESTETMEGHTTSKIMIKLTNAHSTIIISYLEEDDIIMGVTVYFMLENENVEDIINEIKTTIILIEDSESVDSPDNNGNKSNIFKLSISDESLYHLIPLNINSPKWENVNFYKKKVKIGAKKIIKSINNNNKGLNLISGNRGSGKTFLVKSMLPKIGKDIIYIPLNLFDMSISNVKFIDFLKMNQNSVLFIDDCEHYFHKVHQKSNLYVNNLLQILESIEDIHIHILLSLNIPMVDIDENLLFSKSCLNSIDLEVIKGKDKGKLSKKMGFGDSNIKKNINHKKYL